MSDEDAVAGAPALRDFQDSLRVTHDPAAGASTNTVVAHSYGSLVTGHAARDLDAGGLDADQIVTVGSPGMGVDHVDELNQEPGHVWSGSTATDLITKYATHGPLPHHPDFGAHRLDADLTGGHSAYFELNSDSLRNIGHITVGDADPVTGHTE